MVGERHGGILLAGLRDEFVVAEPSVDVGLVESLKLRDVGTSGASVGALGSGGVSFRGHDDA